GRHGGRQNGEHGEREFRAESEPHHLSLSVCRIGISSNRSCEVSFADRLRSRNESPGRTTNFPDLHIVLISTSRDCALEPANNRTGVGSALL
ncbi:MAG TPA: hypothetical protein VEW70_18235, partial [Burkholderiales bacterium]|nr:hypothetical protein [Burkholderiales bacterium]